MIHVNIRASQAFIYVFKCCGKFSYRAVKLISISCLTSNFDESFILSKFLAGVRAILVRCICSFGRVGHVCDFKLLIIDSKSFCSLLNYIT